MTEFSGFISTLKIAPSTSDHLEDAIDNIHSGIIKALNVADAGSFIAHGFMVTSNINGTFNISEGGYFDKGEYKTLGAQTNADPGNAFTGATDYDWYGFIVINSSGAIAFRGDSSLGNSAAKTADLNDGDIPICVVQIGKGTTNTNLSAARKIQYFGIKKTSNVLTAGEENSGDFRKLFEVKTDGDIYSYNASNAFHTKLAFTNASGSNKTVTVPSITGTLITTGDSQTVSTSMIEDGAVTLAKTSGLQGSLTFGIANTNAVKVDGTITNGDFARFTGTGLEGRSISEVKTQLALDKGDVGLGNVDNKSSSTLQTEILNAATASDVGLGNVTNESKATMFTSPTFTGTISIPNISNLETAVAANTAKTVRTDSEINALAQALIDDLIAGAPTALNTLNELAVAIQSNDSDITGITTALGNRLRIDINNQNLNATQLTNVKTNLSLSKADVGLGNVDNDSTATIRAGTTKANVGLSNVLNQAQITTFVSDNAPTATAIGDLWIDSNDNNKMYRASATGSSDWVAVTLGKGALGLVKADVGLGNVDNITTAQMRAGVTHSDVGTTKSDIGLGNVENKSSATIRGEIEVSNIPDLPTSKITTGTFADGLISKSSVIAHSPSATKGDIGDLGSDIDISNDFMYVFDSSANNNIKGTTIDEILGKITSSQLVGTGKVFSTLPASGAEVNVQADFNETDNTSDAFIQNKPTIPSGNQIIDWTQDQGSTNINAGNYINTNQLTTFDIGVDTDNNPTTIAHGETLTFTGGTGISTTTTADGTITITNDNPDQTVSLTGSGATSVSGTYPNFTISSTDNNTFRTVSVDTNGDGSANETLGTSETLTIKKGSNITLAEASGVVTITNAAPHIATNLGSSTATNQITITSSTGNNVVVGEATSSIAGLMSTTHHDKLDGIEASADVTDTDNVTNAGALMDSEVTNLAQVKAFDSSDYATAAQGAKADSAQQPPSEGAFANGDKTKLDHITVTQAVDLDTMESNIATNNAKNTNVSTNLSVSRDGTKLHVVSSDGTNAELPLADTNNWGVMSDEMFDKLDGIETNATADQTGAEIKTALFNESDTNNLTNALLSKLNAIEASADVTDADNVADAGAIMDGDFTSNGFMKRTGAGQYSVDTNTYLTAHPTISGAASSSDNSGRTYIQDITLDSNGHVIGIATATETVTNTDSDVSVLSLKTRLNSDFNGDITIGNQTDDTVIITGDLSVGGDFNITGDINTVNVTDLDVVDKTITVASGATTLSNTDGAGIQFGANASAPTFKWDNSNSRLASSRPISASSFIGDLTGNVTGNASGLSSTLAISSGGTGVTNSNTWLNSRITTNADGSLNYDATTATAVNHDSLAGFVAAEHYRWDNDISSTAQINAANIPTLNQDTTGTAAGLSATLAVSSGGTGSTTAPMVGVITAANAGAARTVLGLGTAATLSGTGNILNGNTGLVTGDTVFDYFRATTLTVGQTIEAAGTNKLQLKAGSSYIDILDGGGNNHINVVPASGRLNIEAETLAIGDADSTITTRGAYDLTLDTNGGTNSGSIKILDGANGNIELDNNGSGQVVFKGNSTKGSGQFVLNCEQNSHGITIKGPPHSAGASYTLTLPNNDGNSNQVLKTDGSGNLSWVDQSSGGISDVSSDTTPQLGGDLDVNGNKITSASNADITIEPNGTGDINLYADTVIAGDASTDFKIQHRTKTNSHMTFLNNGNNQFTADANIFLNADEAGNGNSLIRLNALKTTLGKSNFDATLTTQGTGDLTLSTNGGTNSGTIQISDGANGDITITPNGTGQVNMGNYQFKVDQTLGSGQDNYVLTYDDSEGTISFEANGGGGGGGAVSAVANGANNRIATFSSTDALNGEANLTFDGSTLSVNDAGIDIREQYGRLNFKRDASTNFANNYAIYFYNNQNSIRGGIQFNVSGDRLGFASGGGGGGNYQLYIQDGVIYPPVDDDVDLGKSTNKFKDSFFGLVDAENFKINGGQGSDGQVLTSTGSGVAWENPSGGGGSASPSGSDGQIQYNNNGSFGGDADFVWDDTNNRLVIGSVTSQHDSLKQLTVKGPDAGMLIEKHDNSSSGGPTIALYRYSASEADGDLIGQVTFRGEGSTGNPSTYMMIRAEIEDTTEGTKDGSLIIRGLVNNSQTDFVEINSAGHTLNQGSYNVGNASTDANTVSGSSLGNGSSVTLFTVPATTRGFRATIYVKDTSNTEYQIEEIIGYNTGSGVDFSSFGQVYSGSAPIGSLNATNSSGTTLIQFTNGQGSAINYQASISVTHMDLS